MDNSGRKAGEGGATPIRLSTRRLRTNGRRETGQKPGSGRSGPVCRLCNSCPELRLESCQGSRTARGMTETSTDAAMDWYHQSRLRNQGLNR